MTQEAVTGTSPVSVNKLEALQPPAVQVQPYAVTPTPESVPVPPVPVPPNPAVMAIPSLPSHIFEQGFNPIAPEFHPARRNNGRGVNIQRPPTVYMPPYISPPGAFPEGIRLFRVAVLITQVETQLGGRLLVQMFMCSVILT